ncbi:MAG: ABC transporter ATP-binding protein [Steroidobacteraceae bacterium]
MQTETPLLQLQGYSLLRAGAAPVLQDLSFHVGRGEILGVVGESGSGKSQLLLSLLGIAMRDARATGSCLFDGVQLVGAAELVYGSLRGRRIAMLFQDPLLSWNPYLTIGRQLAEVLQVHRGLSRRAAEAIAAEALTSVGLADTRRLLHQYPHELSGGMRQRAMLAMAVLAEPDLLLADEPTTALDATTQIAILDLLARLRRERGMSVLLVTHDLGVVARVADRVVVMRNGRIVEQGATAGLLRHPASDYARELLAAARQIEHTERGT